MADIDIQRKTRSTWPWIIGLLALLTVVGLWAMWGREPDRVARARVDESVGTSGTAAGGAVSEYLAFAGVTGAGQQAEMGRDHEYTAEGIRKLSEALEAVVTRSRNTDADGRFQRFREVADRIEREPTSNAHADQVREAFTRAADVIASLGGAPSAQPLQDTAQSIEGTTPLLQQRDTVHAFFRQSAEAIQALAQ